MRIIPKACLWALSLGLFASGVSAQGTGGSTEGRGSDAPPRTGAMSEETDIGVPGGATTSPQSGTTTTDPDVDPSTTPIPGAPGTAPGTGAGSPTGPGPDMGGDTDTTHPGPTSPINPTDNTPGRGDTIPR